jgi:DNA-binding response OmpR family regulator
VILKGEEAMYAETILIVDDEAGLAKMLTAMLHKEGFTNIREARTGHEAIKIVQASHVDIILLDVMLPDADGFDVCREFRQITQAPILFLTARSGDYDKLAGLAIGGDDYITKPFNPLEVVARIQANLRRQRIYQDRAGLSARAKRVSFHRITIDETQGLVEVDGNIISLTAKEFELIRFLSNHPYRVFTVQQLYENVWGPYYEGDDKTVVIHISRLRKKVELDAKQPEIIVNLRGIGYKFVPPTIGGQR